MNTVKIQHIMLGGSFRFEPLNMTSLASMIYRSKLKNREQLFQALWWPESDSKAEPYDANDKGWQEKSERNMMRLVHRNLKDAFGSANESAEQMQGKEAELDYRIFTHNLEFRGSGGYQHARERVEAGGLMNPSAMCFISFVLQASEMLMDLGLSFSAAPDKHRGLFTIYPYYKSGQLRFEDNCGDLYAGHIWQMNQGLLFGVKPPKTWTPRSSIKT